LGGIDVKFLACLLVNGLLKLADLLDEFLREPLEERQIQQNASFLHICQDGDELNLDLTVEFIDSMGLQVSLLQWQQP